MHINQLNEAMNPHRKNEPIEPGSVGTKYMVSDRYPIIVVKVISPKRIVVSHLTDADYQAISEGTKTGKDVLDRYVEAYENRPAKYWGGRFKTYTLRKNGRWVMMGDDLWASGAIQIGEADSYRDPCY